MLKTNEKVFFSSYIFGVENTWKLCGQESGYNIRTTGRP